MICPSCKYTGWCPACDNVNPESCSYCMGTGVCSECGGSGTVDDDEEDEDE